MMGRFFAEGSMALLGFGLTWWIQSSALLVLGLVAGRLLRRSGPAVQSAVYRTTLAAVLVSPVASAMLSGAGFEGFGLQLPARLGGETARALKVDANAARAAVAVAPSAPIVHDRAARGIEAAPASAPIVQDPTQNTEAAAPMPLSERSPAAWARVDGLLILGAACVAVWGLGTVFMALRLWVGQRRMVRLRATSIPAGAVAEALCDEVAGRMRLNAPDVLRTPFLFSPCLDGLRRPAILLPEDCGDNLRETFVHELAHLARRDGLWNLLRRCAAAALWVQPLLWILSRRLEATAEEVCDDYVVQFGADRARYAGHLLDLAGRTLPQLAPAGVGMVSLRSLLARRIVRILDSSRSLSTRAGKRAVAVMLLVGLAGTISAGLLGVGGGGRKAMADEPAKVKETSSELATKAVLVRGALVSAEPADVPIIGRIVDLEGRPVAGVSVKVDSMRSPKGRDLTPWLDAVKKGEPPWTAYRHIDGSDKIPEGAQRTATTDKDGRFRLEGLGGERAYTLQLRGDAIAVISIEVVTRRMAPIEAKGFPSTYGPGSETVFGADFTYTARPGRPVEGVVRDATTKQPMAGVAVESYRMSGSDFVGISTVKTVTDAQGRYRLVGLPKGKGNMVLAVPNDDQPYFQREVGVDDPPGIDPVHRDIDLHRGLWISGKVTDKATGEPITDGRLHYLPFLENKYVQALPEFDKNGNVDGSQMRYRTKPDGTYKLVGMPGRAVVGIDTDARKKAYRGGAGFEAFTKADLNEYGYLRTYNNPIFAGKSWPLAMKAINPAEGTESVTLDLQLDPGVAVRLKVVDTDGKPVSGVTVNGSGSGRRSKTVTDGEFDVETFSPGEQRNLVVRHEGRKLGKVVRVAPGDDAKGPVVVTLEPLATIRGRAVDADGHPVPATKVRSDVKPGGDFGLSLGQVVAAQDGRFVVSDVPAGCDYSLCLEAGTMIKERRVAFTDAKVRPGETTDIGDVKFKND